MNLTSAQRAPFCQISKSTLSLKEIKHKLEPGVKTVYPNPSAWRCNMVPTGRCANCNEFPYVGVRPAASLMPFWLLAFSCCACDLGKCSSKGADVSMGFIQFHNLGLGCWVIENTCGLPLRQVGFNQDCTFPEWFHSLIATSLQELDVH